MTLSNLEIAEYIEQLEKESKALIKQLHNLVWQQRGGMSLEEAFQLTYIDREIILELINERIETANESKLPYF